MQLFVFFPEFNKAIISESFFSISFLSESKRNKIEKNENDISFHLQE
jgi:hypothetical protein